MEHVLILNNAIRIPISGMVQQASINGKKHFLLTIFHGEKKYVCASKTLQPFSDIGREHNVYESEEDYTRGCSPLRDVKLIIGRGVKLHI